MRVTFAYAVPAPAAVEMLTACSKKSDGEAGTDEKVAADHADPLMGRIAYAGKHNENGAQLAVEQITTEGRANGLQRNEASDTQATITTINSVQPDVSKPGGMDTTGGPRPKQAATFGIRAKILGGDGVCTDKVGKLAGSAMHNPVCSKAEVALSTSSASLRKSHPSSATPQMMSPPGASSKAKLVCVSWVSYCEMTT